MDLWVIWLIAAAVLAVAELFTLTAALGLLGGAALVTAGFAAVGLPLPLQFLVFTIVAASTVLFIRPVVLRHMRRPRRSDSAWRRWSAGAPMSSQRSQASVAGSA